MGTDSMRMEGETNEGQAERRARKGRGEKLERIFGGGKKMGERQRRVNARNDRHFIPKALRQTALEN